VTLRPLRYEWLANGGGRTLRRLPGPRTASAGSATTWSNSAAEALPGQDYLIFGGLIIPWTRHVKSGRDLLRRSSRLQTRSAILTYAAYSCEQLNTKYAGGGRFARRGAGANSRWARGLRGSCGLAWSST